MGWQYNMNQQLFIYQKDIDIIYHPKVKKMNPLVDVSPMFLGLATCGMYAKLLQNEPYGVKGTRQRSNLEFFF